MKKIKLSFVSLMLALFFLLLAGCNSAPSASLVENMPWTVADKTITETSVYSFNRYLTSETFLQDTASIDDSKKSGYKLNKSGTVTYTLSEGKSIAFFDSGENINKDTVEDSIINNANHTLIKMELIIEYKDDLSHLMQMRSGNALTRTTAVAQVYENKTDKVVSYTVVDRYTLKSLFTFKNTDIQTQADIDTLSYTLISDYTGQWTKAKKATLTDKSTTSSTKIKSGSYYDSESVYFRIRALDTLSKGKSVTFNTAMPYDQILAKNKTLKTSEMSQTTESSLAKVQLAPPAYSIFDIPTDEIDFDNFTLSCYKTELALTAQKSGPGINLYYSYYPALVDTINGRYADSRKVLVKIDYPNHDRLTNSIFNQEYVLTHLATSV